MSNSKTKDEEPAADEREIDNLVRHYGVTREEARRLLKEHGNSPRELEAAAGRLTAKRMS
jgi:hypothetical protein